MDWLQRVNAALDLLEKKLEEPLDLVEIANAANSSPFHFQRMFHMLTGMTVAEYVRKRRLTLAAHELASSGAKVIDVALKYGYDSPESFSKAYQKIHGITPSQTRRSGAQLKAFPRISIEITRKGEQEVAYRIEEKESFEVIGKKASLVCEKDSRLPFWRKCGQDGTIGKLAEIGADGRILGITMDLRGDRFTYMIAARADRDVHAAHLARVTIPAATWAIFTSVGPLPGAIQDVFNQIYQEWFPATGYEHSGSPEIEVYFPGNGAAEDYRCEVWIPVVRN